ncbi:MAG: hypothetical protein J5I98_26275 [Phaeodactylibacter sp.]|nr:hypothetical protein [Phaeodactylibacter sp.]
MVSTLSSDLILKTYSYGAYRGFKWLVRKGKFKSSATVSTTVFDVALGIKDVFEAYRELGCVEWKDINVPEAPEGNYASARIMLENVSNEDVYFQLSYGGVGWESTSLKAGHEMDFAFRGQGYQNFGYCRLNGKTFILDAERTYRFSKNRTNGSGVETATNTFTDRKIGGAGLCAPEAQARMKELLAFHKRKNGKVNRSKVARVLNREGYRRWDGKKFKAKDIPKYEY